MRVVVFLLLLSIQVRGQNSIFLIVDYSAGVTIDGRTPKIDEIVDGTSKEIFIPKNGYALIIVREGYVYSLLKSISVDKVNKKVIRAFRPKATGAVLRSFYGIELVGVPFISQFPDLIGDSILVAVKLNNVKLNPPFVIEYKNMFDEVLQHDSMTTNWKIQKMDFYSQQVLILEAQMGKYRSIPRLIRNADNERKKASVLELSKITSQGRSKIIKLIVLEFSQLFHDQLFLLFKLTTSGYKPENIFLQAYVERLRKKYHFELFDFHK